MNLLGLLENGLFALGQVLRFPVMALLWVCVVAALFAVGRVLVDFVSRRRERHGFDIDSWLASGHALGLENERRARLPLELREMLERIERAATAGRGLQGGALEHLVLEAEERGRAALTMPRLLVKVGPSLGLLGTLIPMGTALAALSTGNLEAMAGQMVVAFTTTIIGLACGTVGFIALAVRQHWVTQTVREQRYLADQVLLARDRTEEHAHG
jgi:biopolymer transport protein ExbB/TolQ